MIKLGDDTKGTPKQLANEILADGISSTLGYWAERQHLTDGMTEREIKLVKDQMQKQANRLVKLLGYEEAWHS